MGILSSLLSGNSGVLEYEKLINDYEPLIALGEEIVVGFKLSTDIFIFTDKRLILIEKHEHAGKNVEYLSIFYKSISRFSVEAARAFDSDSELKIWIQGEIKPSIVKKFSKAVNVYEVQKILAQYV
ncbi:PH domain-containing protein [Marivirga sp. S37H4]|uniref:PH domain-containing protein n=1 Tax=Marivirga aurantiaca TaxID=2802615 RepID=A0A934X2U9_9BACT|nr:PH domain-containing protein [Marivirga aurantiaca]MBK6267437.1 PH domain-containing protein [Marivirga aurantiaca]